MATTKAAPITAPTYADVARSVRYKKCLRHPDKRLVVQDVEGQGYVPWCVQCYREGYSGPALGREDYEAEKRWDMTTREMANRPGQILSPLQAADIKRFLAPKASDADLEIFVRFCQAQSLNPFAKDVYLIPFKNKDGTFTSAIVVGLQFYLKRASRNPLYQTYQSGLIVKRGDIYVDVVGTVGYPGDELYGAWCKVYKKGSPIPFEHRITLKDWDKKRELWLTTPGPMLEVRAISQGIRRAFPEEFGPDDVPQQIEGITVEVAEDTSMPQIAAPPDMRQQPSAAVVPAEAGTEPTDVPSEAERLRHADRDITPAEWSNFYNWAAEKYDIRTPDGCHMILGKAAAEWTGTLRDAALLIQAAKAAITTALGARPT